MAQNKRFPVFWKVYIGVAALLFVALGVWLLYLYGWLDKYEASQPQYYAKTVFDTSFKEFELESYIEKYYNEEEGGVKAETLIEYIGSLIEGKKLSYNRTSSDPKTGLKYVVTAGSGKDAVRIASFVLVENKKGGYDAKDYQIYFDKSLFNNSVNAEIPKGYTLKVNDKVVDSSYITEDNIKTESCDYMPEGVEGLMFTRYHVSGLLKDPKVEILDKNGKAVTPEITEDGYKVTVPYDAELEAQYAEWILEGAVNYASYTQFDEKINTVYFSEVAPWFDPSSELYESIKTMENGFVVYYDDFEFTDKSATEFMKYDENTFSCHIKLTQKMYKNVAGGVEEYVDYIDLTLYLRRVDDQFLIYEMKVN